MADALSIGLSRSSLRVPFGLSKSDGRLYEPRDVSLGKACGCICPGCREQLYAKHCWESSVVPHFAHAPGTDCRSGFESAVHLAAKQLIDAERKLLFPALSAKYETYDALGRFHEPVQQIVSLGERDLTDVRLERQVENVRPDLLVAAEGLGTVMVEVAVTHFVDATKLDKVAGLGIPLLEIDLSAQRTATFESLREVLFADHSLKRWLFHPELKDAERRLEETLSPILEAARVEADMLRQKEAALEAEHQKARRHLVSELGKAEREKKYQQRIELERAARFRDRPEHAKKLIIARRFDRAELPGNLRVKVRGARSFGVMDPLLWQMTLFGGLIERPVAEGHGWVKKDYAVRWLSYRFATTPEFTDSEKIAVWDYLVSLSDSGALIRKHKGYFQIAVSCLAAYETLLAARGASGRPFQLVWVDEEAWPPRETAQLIAMAHAHSDLLSVSWDALSTLLPRARLRTPEEICALYARREISNEQVVEYLICAGFLVAARVGI